MKTLLTSVIIPSRNVDNLRPCIQAFDALARECPIRLIVVDDGLAERPPKMVRDLRVKTVNGQKPFIFARNINIGINYAKRDDVILLNDDALLTTKGGFGKLIQCGAEHPECGLISAATNHVGNANQQPRGVGLRYELRTVCFVCVWIPRRTIDVVGMLDERFTEYGFEDDDYCLRVRNAGLKLGIFDGCVMDHGTLKSTFRSGRHVSLEPGSRIFSEKWGHDNWGRPCA